MKILLINERLDFAGGAERYTADVATGLERLGHEVEVIFGYGDKSTSFSSEVKTTFIKDLAVKDIIRAITIFNPNVINIQNINDPQVLIELSNRWPTVRFIHDHRSYCPGNSKLWFSSNQVCPVVASWRCGYYAFRERCMTRRPNEMVNKIRRSQQMLVAMQKLPKVLCNSRYVRERLIQNGLAAAKIEVNSLFPGGTYLSGNSKASDYSIVPEVLFVGRVFVEKGVEVLLRACALIKDVDFKATIIGDGWDLSRCRELAVELGLAGRAQFPGFLPKKEVDEYYRRCRLLVVPSLWPEGFGMVGLEALSFGKPVVAFNAGGISDWLIDGQVGFLIERGNLEDLAEKIKELLVDSSLAARLGKAGQELVAREFTLDRHLQQLVMTLLRLARSN